MQPDHVHLLLQVSPTDSIFNVMQVLKGGTSRRLRQEFPDLEEFPELEEFLWGDHFWGEGYFAESVGQNEEAVLEEAVLRAYIKNQGQKNRS